MPVLRRAHKTPKLFVDAHEEQDHAIHLLPTE